MDVTRISIRQTDGKWVSPELSQAWPTAGEAEKAVRADAGPGVLIIDWFPTTRVGRAVVNAIAR